jgi:hypothetical protein
MTMPPTYVAERRESQKALAPALGTKSTLKPFHRGQPLALRTHRCARVSGGPDVVVGLAHVWREQLVGTLAVLFSKDEGRPPYVHGPILGLRDGAQARHERGEGDAFAHGGKTFDPHIYLKREGTVAELPGIVIGAQVGESGCLADDPRSIPRRVLEAAVV